MKIEETEAKSMLVPSKLPDADYVVNPYTGCAFACLYCYASFMGRFVNEPITNWGNYVYVKANAVEVFEGDLKRLPTSRRNATILLSSVTDPYQGLEARYRLSRGILEVLAHEQYPGLVSILTKSPLVLRDLDVLRQLPRLEVGMTVTTTDNGVGRFLEVHAPMAQSRLRTLRQLHDEGLRTYAFVGPLLPHYRYCADQLDALFASLAETKVESIFVEHMNLKPYIRERLWRTVEHEPQEVQDVYRGASTDAHREALNRIVGDLIAKYGLRLRLGEVLYHNNKPGADAHGSAMPQNPE